MSFQEPTDRSFPALSGTAWRVADASGAIGAGALPAEFARGDFLVGARGCGEGCGEAVARQLRSGGVAAVIACTIAPSFFEGALEAGLPAVAIEEAAAIKAGDGLRVDIETFRVVNFSSGDRYVIRNLDDALLARLRLHAR